MKNFYSILTTVLFLTFISCDNEKDVLINDFEKFIQKASCEYTIIDEVTRQQMNIKFDELNRRYSIKESELSKSEKSKINSLKGRFFAIRVKHEGKVLKDKLKNGYDMTKGFVNELVNDQ